MTNQPLWLDWAQRLQAIAQSGLTYTTNVFDIERFEDLRQIAAEILAAHTDHDLPYISDLLAGEQGYATPKLDVRGVIFRDDKILLVKERVDGGWTLPGGWIDVGEPPSLAAEREVWEESGYTCVPPACWPCLIATAMATRLSSFTSINCSSPATCSAASRQPVLKLMALNFLPKMTCRRFQSHAPQQMS